LRSTVSGGFQPAEPLSHRSNLSNSDSLFFTYADVIIAPIIGARRFGVRVSRHALRDLDTAAVGEVVGDLVARNVWQPIAVSIPESQAQRRTIRQTSPGVGCEC
jgi:hypothetical protein